MKKGKKVKKIKSRREQKSKGMRQNTSIPEFEQSLPLIEFEDSSISHYLQNTKNRHNFYECKWLIVLRSCHNLTQEI